MQQRAEAHDSLDDFPTPPWATRALLDVLEGQGEALHMMHVWEPACNRGHMARVLAERFGTLYATDVHDYGWPRQDGVADFLIDWSQDGPDVDWIITNPPFRLAEAFITHGLRNARRGVAVLVRSAFLEGQARYEGLFREVPPTLVCPFVERVVMWKNVLLGPDVPVWYPPKDDKPGHVKKPSSATAYAWLVWMKGAPAHHPKLIWVPPHRAALTRPGDYPPLPDHLRPPVGALI
jgi:hypothetical protein